MNADFEMDRPATVEERTEPPEGIQPGQSFEEMLRDATEDEEGLEYSEKLGTPEKVAMAKDIAPADLED